MLNCYCSELAQLVELEDFSEVDQSSPMVHELPPAHDIIAPVPHLI